MRGFRASTSQSKPLFTASWARKLTFGAASLEKAGEQKRPRQSSWPWWKTPSGQPDLAQSMQRYHLAVDQAKVRLNLAVCPGAWLMPARMIINTESTVDYNNKLKQATPGMKLGVNNAINPGTKKQASNWWKGGHQKSTRQTWWVEVQLLGPVFHVWPS